MTLQPRLIPLSLPWCISPSTPFLRLLWEERTALASVEFCADFGPAIDRAVSPSGQLSGEIVDVLIAEPPPIGLPIEGTRSRTRFRWLRASFSGVHTAETHLAHSNTEVIDESSYDWSELGKANWTPGRDSTEFLEAFHKQWLESGLCPDPGIYLVETAELRPETAQYLILGHDAYITATAEAFDWVTVRDLPEW